MSGGKAVMRDAVAASAQAHAQAVADARGEQMELLPPERPLLVNGRMVQPDELQERINARSKAGRPKGAQNLSTREWRDWWLSRGVDPVTSAIHDLAMSLDEFAAHLGCKRSEAWDRRQRLREFVAPFLFARQAPVDDKGNAVIPQFVMNFGDKTPRALDGRALLPWEYLEAEAQPVEENQPLSGEQDPKPQNGETAE